MTAARKPAMTEAQLHKAVADYLAVALPTEGCVWTTFPAGGGGKVRGAQLKGRGLRAGWPDIQILWAPRHPGWGTFFIGLELKAAAGRISPDQIDCHAAIHSTGNYVFICRSVADVYRQLKELGIPLRAKPFGLGTERSAG